MTRVMLAGFAAAVMFGFAGAASAHERPYAHAHGPLSHMTAPNADTLRRAASTEQPRVERDRPAPARPSTATSPATPPAR